MTRMIGSVGLLACLLVFLVASNALAQSTATDELLGLAGKALVEETTQANDELKKAKEILDVVLKDGTPEQQQQAQQEVQAAQQRYNQSCQKLDAARADALAGPCGKSAAEIQALRDSGIGWGRIAKDCGVHPSTLGKGQGRGQGKGQGKNKKPKKPKKPKK